MAEARPCRRHDQLRQRGGRQAAEPLAPGWGLVTFRMSGRNQAGEEVISFIGHVFVESRGETLPDEE